MHSCKLPGCSLLDNEPVQLRIWWSTIACIYDLDEHSKPALDSLMIETEDMILSFHLSDTHSITSDFDDHTLGEVGLCV